MSNVKIENISQTRKRLVVQVSADEVLQADVKVLKDITSQAQIPGFRAGKAPEAMIRQRYGKLIADELKREVITESYEKALKEAKHDLCSVVDIEGDDITVGKKAVVTVTVDIYPEFKLPKYKELVVKLPKNVIDDKEIEKTIDLIRGQRAQFTPVERAAAAGDYVRLNYTGTLNGKAVAEIAPEQAIYGTQKNTWEEAGNHDYGIKAVAEGLIGMKKDDKKTVTHEFDKKFEVKELAGKKVQYEIEVLEVREKKMPELNEEFFKSVGVKDMEELKTQVKSSLEARAQEDQETAKRAQLSDQLVGAVKFPLPESLLRNEEQHIMQEIMQDNRRRGVSEETLQKNQKEILENAKDAAEKRVKLRLILREVAKAEKLEATEEDFQRWIMSEAMSRQMSPDKLVQEISKDREQMSNLAQALKLGKALKFIIDAAKVEEGQPEKKK